MPSVYSEPHWTGDYTYTRVRVDYEGARATANLLYTRTNEYAGETSCVNATFAFGGASTVFSATKYGKMTDEPVATVPFAIPTSGGDYNGSTSGAYLFSFTGGVHIPAQVSPPAGLSLSNIIPHQTGFTADVSISNWGDGGTESERYLELSVCAENGSYQNRRYVQIYGSNLTQTIAVDNVSELGNIIIQPDTTYYLTMYASNGAASIGNTTYIQSKTLAAQPVLESNKLYFPDANNKAKKAITLYVPVGGVSQEVEKLYASKNGKSILVYEKPPYIELVCVQSGNVILSNQWTKPISYSVNGGERDAIAGNDYVTFPVSANDKIVVYDDNGAFRNWAGNLDNSLIRLVDNSNNILPVNITHFPKMSAFTIDRNGTVAGDSFFCGFNDNGSIANYPNGALDTSSITTVGDRFFAYFNSHGLTASFPYGSFKLENITKAEDNFFYHFNSYGQAVEMPQGSLNTSNITSVGDNFFAYFNYAGAMQLLPINALSTASVVPVSVQSPFSNFNTDGRIPKSSTLYTATENVSSGTINAHYWNGTTSDTEAVHAGGQFYWKAG